MLLIVHTYSRLQTTSDGFKAKIRFLDRIANLSKNITSIPDSKLANSTI